MGKIDMMGCGFLVALILAWPTMGLSLLAWLVVVGMNVGKERRLNEFRDARHVSPAQGRAPRREVISTGLEAILEQLSSLPNHEASGVFHELDVTVHGDEIDQSIAAGYLRDAAEYGLENIELLSSHMTRIATTARQRTVTRSAQEAGMRSILYWCLENAARSNRDEFFLVDIAKASRKGAVADQKLLG